MQSSFFGNESDQRSFKKILESVLRRLKDVERNGYIAPGLLEQPTSLAIQDSAAVNDDHNGQSDAAGKKKRKKKKKKKAFSKESEDSDDEGSAKAPSTTSVNTKEPTEDFEDPLVIALLGMGFAKDQIAAAVKACGGTNRATADDLVTWILGQDAEGVVVNESSHASSINSSPQDTAIEVNEKTVVKTKVAEESKPTAEQRRQSEDAAKRLAEKREEQRRRYREWNNREQERQQQQAKAKLALITDPGHRQLTAAPPTYVAPSTSSKVNISDTGIPVVRSGQIALPFNEAPLTTHRNQTVPVKKELTLSTAPLETNMTPLNATSIVTREEEFPALSQSVSTSNQENVHLVRVPPVTGTAVMTFHNSFPPIGDDERTVSSFGSNKGLSVSSASYLLPGVSPSMVMPGALFDPLSILQPGTELSVKEEAMDSVDQVTDTGQGSEIRATAKEFVPKCYASSSAAPSHLAGSMISKALPPLSANFVSGLGGPLRVSLPEGSPPFDSATIPFSQGFLGSSGPPPPVNPSYLSVGLNRYETMPTVTPLSEDTSTAATSIGSSLTGIPGLDDSTLSSGMVPLGLGLEPHPSSGNTTSLLSSVFTSGPALNVASLWGGESTLQASIPISGLPLHFTSDTSAKSEEEEKFGDKPLSFAWGGQGISGGGGQGRGSIW